MIKLTDKLHTFTCLHIPTSKYIQMEMMEFDDRGQWETNVDPDDLMILTALIDGTDFKLNQAIKGRKIHTRDIAHYLMRIKEISKNGVDFEDEYFDPNFKGNRLKYNFGTKKLFLESLIPAIVNPTGIVEFAKFYILVEKYLTHQEMINLFDSNENGGYTDINIIDWNAISKLLKKKRLSIEEMLNDIYLPSMITVDIPGLGDGIKVNSLSEFHFDEQDITIADVLADMKEFNLLNINVVKGPKQIANKTERESKPMTTQDKRKVTAWWKSATKEEIRYLLGKVQKADNIDYV